MNHYATNMFYDKAGRHYWFAKSLKERGYDVAVFCANTFLTNSDVVDTNLRFFRIGEAQRAITLQFLINYQSGGLPHTILMRV